MRRNDEHLPDISDGEFSGAPNLQPYKRVKKDPFEHPQKILENGIQSPFPENIADPNDYEERKLSKMEESFQHMEEELSRTQALGNFAHSDYYVERKFTKMEESFQKMEEEFRRMSSIQRSQQMLSLVGKMKGLMLSSRPRVNERLNDEIKKSKLDRIKELEKEIECCVQGYSVTSVIGEGAHGVVVGVQGKNGKKYVIKFFKGGAGKEFHKEASIMSDIEDLFTKKRHLLHPLTSRIIKTPSYWGIACEAGLSSLRDFKYFLNDTNKELSEDELTRLLIGLWKSLEYIHSKGICHRDIKPDNIILHSEDLSVELIDYSLAALYNPTVGLPGWAGTPRYVDPRIIKNCNENRNSTANNLIMADLFSIGLSILEFAVPSFVPEEGDINRIEEAVKKLSDKEILKKGLEAIFCQGEPDVFTKYVEELLSSRYKGYHNIALPKAFSGLESHLTEFTEYIQKKVQLRANQNQITEENHDKKESPLNNSPDPHKDSNEDELSLETMKLRAEIYKQAQETKMMMLYYENIIKCCIHTKPEEAKEFSEKIFDELRRGNHNECHPLLWSTLGAQMCQQEKYDEAEFMFYFALQKCTEKNDIIISLNNLRCFISVYKPDREYFYAEIFELAPLVVQEELKLYGPAITRAWLRLRYDETKDLPMRFVVSNAANDEFRWPEIMLCRKTYSFPQRRMSLRFEDEEELRLVAIFFFNLGLYNASHLEKCLRDAQDGTLLQNLKEFSFIFNHEYTKTVEKVFKVSGYLDFFIYLLKFAMIILKNKSNSNDRLVLDLIRSAQLIYDERLDSYQLFEDYKLQYLFQRDEITQLLYLMIGSTMWFGEQVSNERWNRQDLLLEKVSILAKATKKIQVHINTDHYDEFSDSESDDEDEESATEAYYENDESDFNIVENLIFDIVPEKNKDNFTFAEPGVGIGRCTYQTFWDVSKGDKDQNWTIYSANLILIGGSNKEDMYSHWLEKNLPKLLTVKALELNSALPKNSEDNSYTVVLKGLQALNLTSFELLLINKKGLWNCSFHDIIDFLQSQKVLEHLRIHASHIDLKDSHIRLLKERIEELQKLKLFNLACISCPNITSNPLELLAQAAAKLPLISGLKLHIAMCERIEQKTEDDVKSQVKLIKPSLLESPDTLIQVIFDEDDETLNIPELRNHDNDHKI